jgi:hypothetical protein
MLAWQYRGMQDDPIKVRVLRLAARMLGGPARLRDALRISSADTAEWLAGTREAPDDVMLRALSRHPR